MHTIITARGRPFGGGWHLFVHSVCRKQQIRCCPPKPKIQHIHQQQEGDENCDEALWQEVAI